jgi:hypothetical protein
MFAKLSGGLRDAAENALKGTEMTFRKPVGRGSWYVVGWRP